MNNKLFSCYKICYCILLVFLLSACKKEKPGPNEVFMDNNAFSPSTITISTGTTITWTNKENVTHTATADDLSFNSGDMAKGKTFSQKFDIAGTVKYHCTHHPGMVGTVIIK